MYRFRAEMHHSNAVIGIVEAESIEQLRREIIVEEWLNLLLPGDSIIIIDKEDAR